MSTQYYKPGESVTLYTISAGGEFNGTLSFARQIPHPSSAYRKLAFTCLALSLVGFFSVSLPIAINQIHYQQSKHQQNTILASSPLPTPTLQPNISPTPEPESTSAVYSFRISIPKINVDSPIVADVDPNSEQSYKAALLTGIAQARGSYLPGQPGPIFLFSHSVDSIFNITQYNAQFYALKELSPGDEINVFYKGKKYHYLADSQLIVGPTDLDVIRRSQADLILQTCWPPGTNWQRLLVFAHLEDPTKPKT